MDPNNQAQSSSGDQDLDLMIDDLLTPTEHKTPGAEPVVDTEEADYDKSKFTEEPAPETEESSSVSDMEAESMAEAIVESIDLLQVKLFPKAFEAMSFTAEEKEQYRRYMRREKMRRDKTIAKVEVIEAVSEDEHAVLEKVRDLIDYEDSIPYSAREKANLKKKFAKVLGGANVEMSPGAALLMAVAIITLPRVLPLIYQGGEKLMDKWSKKADEDGAANEAK